MAFGNGPGQEEVPDTRPLRVLRVLSVLRVHNGRRGPLAAKGETGQ